MVLIHQICFGPFKQSQNIQEVTDKLMKNFKIQMDHALLLTKIINKGIHLIAYSPNVKPEILRTMYFEPAAGLQQAIEKAYQYHILNSKKMI